MWLCLYGVFLRGKMPTCYLNWRQKKSKACNRLLFLKISIWKKTIERNITLKKMTSNREGKNKFNWKHLSQFSCPFFRHMKHLCNGRQPNETQLALVWSAKFIELPNLKNYLIASFSSLVSKYKIHRNCFGDLYLKLKSVKSRYKIVKLFEGFCNNLHRKEFKTC